MYSLPLKLQSSSSLPLPLQFYKNLIQKPSDVPLFHQLPAYCIFPGFSSFAALSDSALSKLETVAGASYGK